VQALTAQKPESGADFSLATAAGGVTEKEQVKDKKAVYTLMVNNPFPKSIPGIVTASFYDFSKREIAVFRKRVELVYGSNKIDYPFVSREAFLRIQYT